MNLRGEDESLRRAAEKRSPFGHVLIVTTPCCDYTRMSSRLGGDAWVGGELLPAVWKNPLEEPQGVDLPQPQDGGDITAQRSGGVCVG